MKTHLLILTVFLSLTVAHGQTNVSGLISTNTNWNLAGSPYIVVGNTLVQQGATLTIDAGVVIKFDSGKAIQIEGELIAIGNSSNKILFTSNTTTSNGAWAKIQFADSSKNAVVDTNGNYFSGSIMTHCNVLYGGGSGTGTIQTNNASPLIRNCNVLNSGSDGIHIIGSPVRVDSCLIKNCTGAGLYFESPFYYGCNLIIQKDSIVNNNAGGIYFYGFGSNSLCSVYPCKIQYNYFGSNHQNGAIADAGGGSVYGSMTISNNKFENNTSTLGGAINTSGNRGVTISCNTFIGNQATIKGGAIIMYGYSNPYTWDVTNNIFDNNSSPKGASIYFDFTYANTYNAVNLTGNVIRNNIIGGSSVYCQGNTGNGIGNITTIFQFSNNNFYNNKTSSVLLLNYFKGNINNNNFINPGSTYEIDNYNITGAPSITANNNYWGTTNTQHVDSVINDFFDNSNLTVVNYNAVLTSPILTDTSCISNANGISNIEVPKNKLTVFPNPFSWQTTLQIDNFFKNASLTVYNSVGQIVKRIDNLSGQTIVFYRDNLPSGLYFVRLTQDGNTISADKFVITDK